jgi:hypothetical protein
VSKQNQRETGSKALEMEMALNLVEYLTFTERYVNYMNTPQVHFVFTVLSTMRKDQKVLRPSQKHAHPHQKLIHTTGRGCLRYGRMTLGSAVAVCSGHL